MIRHLRPVPTVSSLHIQSHAPFRFPQSVLLSFQIQLLTQNRLVSYTVQILVHPCGHCFCTYFAFMFLLLSYLFLRSLRKPNQQTGKEMAPLSHKANPIKGLDFVHTKPKAKLQHFLSNLFLAEYKNQEF